jgi:hypothetical protein
MFLLHVVQLRNYLVANTNWAQSRTQVLHVTSQGIVIMKGSVVTILTNIGSPVRFESKEWVAQVSQCMIRRHKTRACLHIPLGLAVSRVTSELGLYAKVVMGVILTRSPVFYPASNGL